jgi:hypothetical protein
MPALHLHGETVLCDCGGIGCGGGEKMFAIEGVFNAVYILPSQTLALLLSSF